MRNAALRTTALLTAFWGVTSIPAAQADEAAASANGGTAKASQASHPDYSTNTPVRTLMDDPAARAVFQSLAPIAEQANQNPMGRQRSLRQMQSCAPGQLSDTKLDQVDAALAKLNDASSQK